MCSQEEQKGKRLARLLLFLGILVPLIYLGAVLGSAWYYPGYDHVTQYVSELGAKASPHREIFNDGIMACGVAAILGAFGFFLALHRLSRGFVFATLTTVALGIWGISMVMGGYYPLPDPRHNAYGLGMAIEAAPLFLLLALMRSSKLGWLKALSVLVLLASGGLLAIMMGAGQMAHIPQLVVHKSDVGLWQRAYAASIIPWIGLAALGLSGAMARVQRRAAIAPKLAMD
jgi:glucan biosynthesis protein C